jgi:hypothetical protein
MTARGRSPSAIAGYDNMPGYGSATVMYRELVVVAKRLYGSPYGLSRALEDRALRALLATAEAGARLRPPRRKPLYRAAWLATQDCDSLLDAAARLHDIRPELLMPAHAMVRQTRQAVTIAINVMTQRVRRGEG